MRFNSSNPILSESRFADSVVVGEAATLGQTINRCLILLALVVGSAAFAWTSASSGSQDIVEKSLLFSIFAFFIVLVTNFKKEWAGVTAPLYAVFEGLTLGAISRVFEFRYPGIVFQAVGITFGIAFGMLMLYKYKVISVNDKYRAIVGSAMFGIFIYHVVAFVLYFFGIRMPLIWSSSLAGIIFTLFVVVISSMYLAIDFDQIVYVSRRGLPAYMSWFAAMGLMVTLVWVYFETLRLLSKIRSRN